MWIRRHDHRRKGSAQEFSGKSLQHGEMRAEFKDICVKFLNRNDLLHI